ncbi:MAG: hypothetical protein ACOX85_10875 [Candidatus Pararuminococcus gallinarum]|jgi:hypothetical protein
MDNDSGALILLIVLIVSAFLLIVLKLAQFVDHFSREKRYLLTEMNRAADYNEYRYWRRELRCLYLCLIPFVTERNVMKVYPVFFHRAKHAAKKKRSDGLMHILAPSMLAICICAICLCGASWAWFTASTSTGTTQIQSSSYKLLYQVDEDATATELAEAGTAYTLTSDTTVITLKANGTAGATGYCSIKIGDETYYTEQILVNDTSEFTFTVNAAAGTEITLTPKWGTYSHAATLHNGDVIPATGSQQSNTQTPDNTVTIEPSTEPAPTTPTAPTTPSSTPAESATTAPEPSATAPAATQPEPTDTEPTPAPEDTTPAASEPTDTTSDSTE